MSKVRNRLGDRLVDNGVRIIEPSGRKRSDSDPNLGYWTLSVGYWTFKRVENRQSVATR